MSIATGTRLGQYEVQDFIGQGAMGVVFRAYHRELERTGAVKIMQALSPDPDSVTRFRHEAQAIAQLRHPNIVNVYDFGAYEGTPYMIVEYIPGGSLAARMAAGRLDRPTAIRYLRGIAAGLDYAHGHGVVHRDVKPANVLLSTEDAPVLADFGLAKLLQGSSLKSLSGVTTGTPAYMAPEQVTGHDVGPAADRYSLATIAYEMLTGVIPFDGDALMEMLYAQVHREPPPPSSRLPDLGPGVDAVILRGLAKDPAARWGSAGEFVEALAAALQADARGAVRPPPPPAMASTLPLSPQPALQSTVPLGATAVAERGHAKPRPATEVVALPQPTPIESRVIVSRRPRLSRRRVVLGLAALLVLLLVLGTCAALAQVTALTVFPDRAARGEAVTVKATHVPANQVGEIQLWSVVHTFPFRADSSGNVSMRMVVPGDVALGDHEVKICWNDTCHAQAPLKVVAGLTAVIVTPSTSSPGGTPAASPTGTPVSTPTPSPGSTVQPTANPTSQPTAAPTARPTPPPASPTPTSNPCPGNSNAAALSPATQSVLVAGGNASFSGSNFTPNSTVSLSYYAPATSYPTATHSWSVVANCSGAFSTSVATKTNTGLVLRTDKVIACDAKKGCVSATITVAVGL